MIHYSRLCAVVGANWEHGVVGHEMLSTFCSQTWCSFGGFTRSAVVRNPSAVAANIVIFLVDGYLRALAELGTPR
jgi:hypothetical protein